MSYMMRLSGIVLCELVGPRHTVVSCRRGMWSRRLGLVLYEQRQLYNGAEVVMAVDAGLVELTVQIVLEAANDDVRVDGKDRYEGRVGIHAVTAAKQYVNLQQSNYRYINNNIVICKARKVSGNTESVAPAVARWAALVGYAKGMS